MGHAAQLRIGSAYLSSAGGGDRTPTSRRTAGFKPAASASSATPAGVSGLSTSSLAGLQGALREDRRLGAVVAERGLELLERVLVEARALGPLRPRGERDLVPELRQRRDEHRV